MAYFSQREYRAFLAASVSHVAVAWLALAGRPMNKQQRDELTLLLDEFFRKSGHRSFRKHKRD